MRRKGEAFAEYALVMGLVAAALTGISVYVRRGIEASVKMTADEIGWQEDGIRSEAGTLRNRLATTSGAVRLSETQTQSTSNRNIQTTMLADGAQQMNVLQDKQTTVGTLATRGANVSTYREVWEGPKD